MKNQEMYEYTVGTLFRKGSFLKKHVIMALGERVKRIRTFRGLDTA